jgi:hypothetical protein
MTSLFIIGRRSGRIEASAGAAWGLVCAAVTSCSSLDGNLENSKLTKAAWDQALSNTIEQACERAIFRLFSDVRDEAIKQALAQAFLAGVDWCFSEQSDNDIAEAALAIGLDPDEAVTGSIPQMLSTAC